VSDWTPTEDSRRAAARVWLDWVAAQAFTTLHDHGVRAVLLKGPSIARWLYADEPEARSYNDVDALVGPEQLHRAEAVLEELGYARRTVMLADDAEPHAEPFVRDRDGATVDLHRTLHRCEHLPDELVWRVVTAGAGTMRVGTADVEVPSVAVRLLHVTFHPDPTKGPPGSQPWLDLERAIARVDVLEWEQAVAVARTLGTTDAMGYGLRLLPEGAALADRLGLPDAVPESVRLREATTSTRFVVQLAAVPGPRAKARYLVQKLFPPRAYMEQSTDLARHGGVRLLAAYLLRLGHALGEVPGAVRGWREVRAARPGSGGSR